LQAPYAKGIHLLHFKACAADNPFQESESDTRHFSWSYLSFPSRYYSLSPIDSSIGFGIAPIVQTMVIGSTLSLVMPYGTWICSLYVSWLTNNLFVRHY